MEVELPQLDNERTVDKFNEVLFRLSDDVFKGRGIYRSGATAVGNVAYIPKPLSLEEIMPYKTADNAFKTSEPIVFIIPKSVERKLARVEIIYMPQYFQGQVYNEYFPMISVDVHKIGDQKKNSDTSHIQRVFRQFELTPKIIDHFNKRQVQATLKAK
jgi:hypothetical protein